MTPERIAELRDHADRVCDGVHPNLLDEALDEVERLRAKLDRWAGLIRKVNLQGIGALDLEMEIDDYDRAGP